MLYSQRIVESACTVYVHEGRLGIWFFVTKSISRLRREPWRCLRLDVLRFALLLQNPTGTMYSSSGHPEETRPMVCKAFLSRHVTPDSSSCLNL